MKKYLNKNVYIDIEWNIQALTAKLATTTSTKTNLSLRIVWPKPDANITKKIEISSQPNHWNGIML